MCVCDVSVYLLAFKYTCLVNPRDPKKLYYSHYSYVRVDDQFQLAQESGVNNDYICKIQRARPRIESCHVYGCRILNIGAT